MLDLAGGTTVYLACGATDLRKSYHGLAAIIKLKFKLDPYSRCMFAFCNLIIPELSEPPVRILGATIPENESHIFR